MSFSNSVVILMSKIFPINCKILSCLFVTIRHRQIKSFSIFSFKHATIKLKMFLNYIFVSYLIIKYFKELRYARILQIQNSTAFFISLFPDHFTISLGYYLFEKNYSKTFGIHFVIWYMNWVETGHSIPFAYKTNTFFYFLSQNIVE